MKLLLVHPSQQDASKLRHALMAHGHVVDVSLDADHAEALLGAGSYELTVLRDSPPDLLATQSIGLLARAAPGGPILVLGGASLAEERVRVLRAGADDYLPEPFALTELLARIEALRRRRGQTLCFEDRIAFADLELDLLRRHASRQGRSLALTAQEFVLLAVLARHAGTVLSRAQLREQLWCDGEDGDTNVVEVAIRRLRSKLDKSYRNKLLRTVRGAGYVLMETSEASEDAQV